MKAGRPKRGGGDRTWTRAYPDILHYQLH